MYVCIHMYVCIRVYACIYVSVYYMHIHVCGYIVIYARIHVYVYICTHMQYVHIRTFRLFNVPFLNVKIYFRRSKVVLCMLQARNDNEQSRHG